MSTDSTAAIVASLPAPVAAARSRLNRATVILAFLSIYLIWGSTYLAIRYAVETIPPLYTAGLRHLLAGSILLVWCLAKRLRPTWGQVRASIIIGFFCFLVRWACLFQAVASLRASASLVGAFVAGWICPTASGRHCSWGVPRIFARICISAFVAGAWLSHPLRLGCCVHGLQLAPRALLSHACCHAYLRQSDCRRSAWLAVRQRSGHAKRAAFHRDGHWSGYACRSRHVATSPKLLVFRFTRQTGQ